MAYSFGATIGDKLGRIQTDTSGLDEARKVGGGIRRAVGDVLGAYRAGKVEDEAQRAKATGEENKAKVQAIVQEYNNQASPEYEGMTPSQRALKVSRLLYPLDQPMSQRYEDYARSIQQTKGKYEQEQNVADTKVEARAGEMAAKNADAQALKAEQDKALVDLQEATKVWQTNPDDSGYQNMVRDAVNNAKRLKLNPENPIDDYMRAKSVDATVEGTKAYRDFNMNQTNKEFEFKKEQVEKAQTEKTEAKDLDLEKRAEKVMPIYGVYKRLIANPEDIPARNDAMNRLLRDESGAAIGKDEVLSRLATVLDGKDYEALVSDLGGLKGWISETTGNENLLLIQSMQKYLGRMNVERMKPVLKDRIGSDRVFNYLEGQTSKPVTQQKAGTSAKASAWVEKQKAKLGGK